MAKGHSGGPDSAHQVGLMAHQADLPVRKTPQPTRRYVRLGRISNLFLLFSIGNTQRHPHLRRISNPSFYLVSVIQNIVEN